MTVLSNSCAIDDPMNRGDCLEWNRLHSEREDICEALLKEPLPGSETETTKPEFSNANTKLAASWHKELLQSRLRKIDDALDRLTSGTYGSCIRCGRWIEDTKLDFDPAIAFCIECWERQQSPKRPDRLTNITSQLTAKDISTNKSLDYLSERDSADGVAVKTLAPFDTICVRTRNSDYRILVLNPRSGRALIEGSHHAVEPVETAVSGSTLGASAFINAWIGIGHRMGFWTDGKFVSTSPVQSLHIEHCMSDKQF